MTIIFSAGDATGNAFGTGVSMSVVLPAASGHVFAGAISNSPNITTATFDGDSMTFIANIPTAAGNRPTALSYIDSSAYSAATYTAELQTSGGNQKSGNAVVVYSALGAVTVVTADSVVQEITGTSGTETTATVTVATTPSDIILIEFCIDNANGNSSSTDYTLTSGCVLIASTNADNADKYVGFYSQAAHASNSTTVVRIDYSSNSNHRGGIIAVPLREAGGGGSIIPQIMHNRRQMQ
jgi:hypothetical protein